MPTTITRFAPSPSGYLHIGHIYAAYEARRHADDNQGEMRLRLEDIDKTRCRPDYAEAILDDLNFMGIIWDGEVMVQTARMPDYKTALDTLKARELIYPCFLSRREVDDLLSAPHLPPTNTDTLIPDDLLAARQGQESGWRLRMDAVRPLLAVMTDISDFHYTDAIHGRQPIDLSSIGDEIIARKDIGTSYHLAVVIDDAAQGVNLITRGNDLMASTPLHRILQLLLDLPEPTWLHHPLLLNDDGQRFAKRDNAISINRLRKDGMRCEDILDMIAKAPKLG